MLAGFKVRVWEADEEFGELVAGEVVWEEFHGVGADGGYVLVGGEGCCGAWRWGCGCGCGWGLRLGGGC